jgi:hypothetical protein
MNQFRTKALSIPLGPFFGKFFAAQGAPQVSSTPVTKRKNLQSENYFVWTPLGGTK